MDPDEELFAGLAQELKRGTVVLACLSVLRTPLYGYALLSTLAEAGFAVDANTLYPLLRRLEKQGLLRSEWNIDEARPRKFYEVTEPGRAVLDRLTDEWVQLDHHVRTILGRSEP
jgi:PadR family transcriptional regulator PadR